MRIARSEPMMLSYRLSGRSDSKVEGRRCASLGEAIVDILKGSYFEEAAKWNGSHSAGRSRARSPVTVLESETHNFETELI